MKSKHGINAIIFPVLFFAIALFAGCGDGDSIEVKEKQEVKDSPEGAVKYAIDTKASNFGWIGKKVAGQHNGTIDISEGVIDVQDGKVVGGDFKIDMNSIKVLDIEDPKDNGDLVGHLKSDDFFSSEKFPAGEFKITEVTEATDGSGNTHNVKGNLTIKGIEKNISFPAKINIGEGKLTAAADFDIDRTEYDIKYGSGKFFEDLGDKMINDDFNINFELTANKQ